MADTIGWSCLAGTPVPRLGQGTWYLGEGRSPRKQELAALRTGVDAGMTLIDTAEMYGEGRSEKLVGEAIAPYDREKLFLVSKVYPWNAGEDQIFRSCENTLRRLKTDYLDMYLLHWRGSVPLEETAECMEDLVRRGLIRQWGVSNLDKEDMEELWESGAGRNCRTDQCLYHLGSRGVETVLLPWLRQHNVSLMAYCPLAQGGTLQNQLLRSPVLMRLAEEKHCTVFQLLLVFLLADPAVVAIPRSGDSKHTLENAAAAGVTLSPEEWALMNQAFPAPRHREPLDIL
ncbi:MAG: aldo/keto reductase [Oscillospiraceae bacterium]|nr:aldo/keto reductase [Oscillospiraceae bacterium]